MTSKIIDLALASLTVVLFAHNIVQYLRTGQQSLGKIARAMGPFGYPALLLACASMAIVGVCAERGGWSNSTSNFLGRAGETLQVIIAVDNFLNGGEPPQRRRREWLKNKFAKWAPAPTR